MLFVTAVMSCMAIAVVGLEHVKFHSVVSRFVSNTLLVHYGKCRSPYWLRLQQPQEQRYPFLAVCAVSL